MRSGFGPQIFQLSATIAVIIAALFAVDKLLAGLESREIRSEVNSRYESAKRQLQAGDNKGALASLRRAHALARGQRDIVLALSEALAANGMNAEAEAQLNEVLREDSNDGRANLLLARLLASENRTGEASAYYHRAIYGTWRSNRAQETLKARMELVRYLARAHQPQRLLSELLLLEDAAEKDAKLEHEVAALFIDAGSAGRAQQIYRDLLRKDSNDWQAYQGLGEANLLEGDFRVAEAMFQTAARNGDPNPELGRRAEFANRLSLLDPTPRRMSSALKLERATHLLQAVRADAATCPAIASSPGAPLLGEADKAIAERQTGTVSNEKAEIRLSLAEQLWELRGKLCSRQPAVNDTIPVIMHKLQQTH